MVVMTPGHLSARTGDEAVVLGVDKGIYYGFDEVAARIWELLQTPVVVSEIRDEILRTYEVDRSTCERDLLAFLSELGAERIIVEVTDGQPG